MSYQLPCTATLFQNNKLIDQWPVTMVLKQDIHKDVMQYHFEPAHTIVVPGDSTDSGRASYVYRIRVADANGDTTYEHTWYLTPNDILTFGQEPSHAVL